MTRNALVPLIATLLCSHVAQAGPPARTYQLSHEPLHVAELTADDLARPSTPAMSTGADDDNAEADELAAAASGALANGVAPASIAMPAFATPAKPTPGPSFPPFDSLSGNDPQIAVSRNFVVVTSYGTIEVYDKSGHTLGPKHGHPFTNPFSTIDLYRPLWNPASAQNINTALNLPPSLKCNPHLDFTLPANAAATRFCLNEYYDTRVVYDGYRNRFWIVSLARNTHARTKDDGSSVTNPNILMGRRSYVLAAVSRTEDPRDGFYETYWGSAADEGACNLPADVPCPGSYFHPGDAGDYPMISITNRYLVVSLNVNNVISSTSRYGEVVLLRPDQLAQGHLPASWRLFNISDYDGNLITGGIVPAVALTDPGYTALAVERQDSLVVLGINSDSSGAPVNVVHSAVFLGRDFVTPRDAPLPGTGKTMLLSNIRGIITGLVFRQGFLYASVPDCVSFFGGGCSDGVRLIRVDAHILEDFDELPNDAGSGFFDITFGGRADDDPPNAVVDFGLPNLMLTRNGDMVIVYVRAGKTVFPEVRYTILYDAETLPRSPVLLRKGNFAATGNIDTGGIALDPSDNLSIWMAHGFGNSKAGTDTLAVGKVKP